MRRLLVAALVGATMLMGCGSSDDDDSQTSSQPTVGSTTTPQDAAATIPEELVGEYETALDKKDTPDPLLQTTFLLYIYDDGTLSFVQQGLGAATGTLTVEGDQVTFDMSNMPDMSPCRTSPTATYKWKATSKSLTLTAVDEKCDARKTSLTSHPLTRE